MHAETISTTPWCETAQASAFYREETILPDKPCPAERPQCPCNAAESEVCIYVCGARSFVLVETGELLLEHIEEILPVWHLV